MGKLLIFVFVLFLLAAGVWLVTFRTGSPAPAVASAGPQLPTFRLGVIPEKDLFQQRKAYRALGDYLENKQAFGKQPMHVELVTASSYDGALKDFEEGQVDGAFVGSLVAVLAADRFGAQVAVKSESRDGASTYHGVIIVREDSPVRTFADTAGKRIGGVRTTTAGAVFPVYLMSQPGAMPAGAAMPTLVWSGTHDDVIRDVLFSLVDAGAVKNTRLEAYQRDHPDARIRQIASGPAVPDNALLLRRNLPEEEKGALVTALLKMDSDTDGRQVLATMELNRFAPCDITQYAALFDLIKGIGPNWNKIDAGPAPTLPSRAPAPAAEGGR